jgi:hypothetical protein
MSNKQKILAFIICVLFIQIFLQESSAQNTNANLETKTPEPDSSPDPCKRTKARIDGLEFAEIIRERDITLARIVELKEILRPLKEDFETSKPQKEIDQRIAQLKEEDKKIKSLNTLKPESEVRFDPNQKSKEEYQKEIREYERELGEQKIDSRCMDLAISSFKTPVQDFKKTMSMIFAGLIGLVIVGFFVVALKDEKIRQAIFSSQTGIQLLTLFSIVIAIILFGITGILHDKELAALLGGLSGYILGRYSQVNSQSEST